MHEGARRSKSAALEALYWQQSLEFLSHAALLGLEVNSFAGRLDMRVKRSKNSHMAQTTKKDAKTLHELQNAGHIWIYLVILRL